MEKRKLTTVVVALFGAAIVVVLFRFNATPQSFERYVVGNIVGLLWIPMLSIFLILRDHAEEYGFGPGESKRVWLWVLILAVPMLLGEAVVARWPQYQTYYPMYRRFGFGSPAGADVRVFLYFTLIYGLYLFCWEFFFRGYLLFGLARTIGWWAVILQTVPFGMMHYGKPEFCFSFVGGVILGALAYSARSFVPAFVLHWIAATGLDLLVTAARH